MIFFICLFVLKDLLFKCRTVSDYLQREDIDIISALQVVDTTVKTIRDMRNETKSIMIKLLNLREKKMWKCWSLDAERSAVM